jgi:cob(I)alamin adenosyltransferase
VKVYTRTGDQGQTALLDGSRVAKSDPHIEAYGTLDELQAQVAVVEAGLARDHGDASWAQALGRRLDRIQATLFAACAALSDPDGRVPARVAVEDAAVAELEAWIDEMSADLPPQARFVRPSASVEQAQLNVARTVCRRAERRILQLAPDRTPWVALRYVNRLSDWLFVAARWTARMQGVDERYF